MNCVGYCAGTFVFRIGSPKSKHKKLKNERAIHLPKSVWREVHGVAFGKQFVGLLKLFWLICSLRANSPGKVKFFTKKCVSRRLRQNIQEGWVDKWKRMKPWRYRCGLWASQMRSFALGDKWAKQSLCRVKGDLKLTNASESKKGENRTKAKVKIAVARVLRRWIYVS